MADTITQEQLQELRRDEEETKWLTFTVLQMWIGKEKADQALAKLREWLDDDVHRFNRGMPVYAVAGAGPAYAAKPRAEVVAVKGAGRITMRHLESAMAERGLTFAEAS